MRRLGALFLLAVPATASANIGLPMVALFLPPMWLALVAIIAVESLIMARLCGTSFRKVVIPVTYGNAVSTIIGIPLVWFLLAVAELVCCGTAKGLSTFGARVYAVTVQAPWLIPYEDNFYWMIPAALSALLIPFLAASVAIEAPFNKRFLSGATSANIWRATTFANLGSYACLAALMVLYVSLGERLDNIGKVFTPLIEWVVGAVFAVAAMFSSK